MTATAGSRMLLASGAVVTIRRLETTDAPAVVALHASLDELDRRLRFLGPVPHRLDQWVRGVLDPAVRGRLAVGAFRHGELVGMATWGVLRDPAEAEVSLVVHRSVQGQGVGTLLLEALVSYAFRLGIRRFVAEVSGENVRMMRVFDDLGLPCTVVPSGPHREVIVAVAPDERYHDAVVERERHANRTSLRPLLLPASVTVIGASRTPGRVGHAVVATILASEYRGELTVVNPHAEQVLGVSSYATVAQLPSVAELAVVCVPARSAAAVVEECGRHGVAGIVMLTSGITGTLLERQIRDSLVRYGMRLIGPNCVGIASTHPSISLNATFLEGPVRAGSVGVVTQSGGVGIAIAELLDTLEVGISTLVSTGDKYDVSGNDLLLWYLDDPATAAVVLYVESFGNPRKFSRIARVLARRKPVLAVRAGSTDAGQRAAASHTAATATPVLSRDLLFEQAGVIAVDNLSELVGVLAAHAWQPLPRGPRVAVVSNAGGLGVLATDACLRYGLRLAELAPSTRRTLRRLLPKAPGVANPLDTGAAVDGATFGACVTAVAADEGVDIVIAEGVATALGDPARALPECAPDDGTVLVAVRSGQLPTVMPLRDAGGKPVMPCYGDADLALSSVAHLARYTAWLAEPAGRLPELGDLREAQARSLVDGWLADNPDGGWLVPEATDALLRSLGFPVVDTVRAENEDEAAAALRRFDAPVAIKVVATGLLHKAREGGVVLDVENEHAAREAFRTLRGTFGERFESVLVQPMLRGERELLFGLHNDGVFGPLVVFGLGGTDTDLLDDRTARLVPLTDANAHRMVRDLRCSPALLAGGDPEELERLLLRVSAMAELLPEVAELDLNPVLMSNAGCVALDARVLLRPLPRTKESADFPRSLLT
ncbi:GNAT family N-acetyltransferase [Haloechinothrix sp. LS1_15]|uniref:GNAT family N-acetyltransferase n=1 Tax=Haloechinothrix sp. LS1_15 TaxID=2652248 RepID=UPI002944A8B0|nr:GNAT family N-acetyltransferase [Haloechinothrix sp. LS1_15]MDV6014261.1 GNAT family N-acetyltransferase [Haloechinothrix sp. LS1_15]